MKAGKLIAWLLLGVLAVIGMVYAIAVHLIERLA